VERNVDKPSGETSEQERQNPDKIKKIECLLLILQSTMSSVSFKIGDKVKYETVDEEYYSRGYGICMETKTSQVVSICYKLANGEVVEQRKLSLVNTVESKSDPPKQQ
jgi:hypothetical protein